jgi:hypothetical protein
MLTAVLRVCGKLKRAKGRLRVMPAQEGVRMKQIGNQTAALRLYTSYV